MIKSQLNWLSILGLLIIIPFLSISCSGGADGDEQSVNAEDDSLNAVPPGEEEPADEEEQEVDSHVNARASDPASRTASDDTVYYRVDDGDASDDCTFVYPFTLAVSSDTTTATFRERETSAATYTITGGAFWVTIEDSAAYNCYMTLFDDNMVISTTCYAQDGSTCENFFLADELNDEELALSEFVTDTAQTTCDGFPSSLFLEILNNRAYLSNTDGSKTEYVLTGAKAFKFMNSGSASINANGLLSGVAYPGGTECTFAGTILVTPEEDPLPPGTIDSASVPGNRYNLDCNGNAQYWYGPCMMAKHNAKLGR